MSLRASRKPKENGQTEDLSAMLRGRVTEAFKDRVLDYARANDITETQIVRLAVKEWLARQNRKVQA